MGANSVVYLAIYRGEKFTVELEYLPLGDGIIEIVSAHVQPRLADTIFEGRSKARRWRHIRPQIDQDPRDEA